jgi:hypothetical protein
MPDGWEVAYNLNPTNAADANEDLDGDGWSNLREYEQGTQPNNASSAPTPIQPISVTAQYKNWIVNRSKCGYAPFVPTSPPKRYLRRTPYGEYWACYYGTCGDNPGTVPNDGYTVLFGNFAGSARIRFVGGSTWYDPQTCQEFNNAMYIWAYSSGSVCNQPDNCDVCEDSCYVWRGPALWTGAYGIGDGNSFPLQTRTETTLFNAPGQIENVVWHTGNGIILSDEYTTPMFEEITRNQLNAMPEPTQWATGGSALRNLSDDQLNIALRKMKYRFAFQGQNGSGYRLTWVERFTPKGGGNPLDTTKSATVAANGGTQYTSEYEVQPPSNNGTITVVPSLARLEIDGGNIVWDNWDDDNNDGIPDKEEFSSTTFDNDLVPLRIIVGPLENGKQVTLSVTQGADKIRVWTSANKQTLVLGGLQPSKTWTIGVDTIPSTLYVEGINKSSAENDVELKLTYSLANVETSLRLTVVKLNLGAAVYRRLASAWIPGVPEYDHVGIVTDYAGPRTKQALNDDRHWIVRDMPWRNQPMRTLDLLAFRTETTPYFGQFSYPQLSDRDRIKIPKTVSTLADQGILYPDWTILAPLAVEWWGMETNTTIGALSEIQRLRCDGLIEVAYEANNVMVWGQVDNNVTYYSIMSYPHRHNDRPDATINPETELSPRAQRGGFSNSNTTFQYVRLFEPVLP